MVQHRRGPWSQHEDSWLLSLVHRNGPHNWVRISTEIGTRSPKQCRERYHQNLKPTLNHDPITPEEGEQIERMVQEMGKRWAEIARRLKGRSDNAVKNWWNGGQNRRKRNPERPAQHMQEEFHDPRSPYSYPSVHQRPEQLSSQHVSRPVFNATEATHSLPMYAESRRPSINSPHSLRLPQPHSYEPSYSRPHPLELGSIAPYHTQRGRGYETPMPSPSGYSVVSADGAPSLITDTGSESRSPRGAASPLDLTLAPLVGGRDERKNSCTRYLPATGFAIEDDDHTGASYNDPYRRRASIQLPPPQRAEASKAAPMFREPNYKSEPSLPLSQHQSVGLPPLPVDQRPLPSYHNLTEPKIVSSPGTVSPVSRQLPSPLVQTRSEPTSPKSEARDARMAFRNILSN